MALATSVPAEPLPQRSPWFEIPANARFETGDTWAVAGKRFRLYGVQSCLRQTSFTNEHNQKRDCGEASLAMLIALIRDLKPLCYSAAAIAGSQTQFVFCFGVMPQGRDKGARVDLGMSLVTLGYGFASLKLDGTPLHQPYLGAQKLAKSAKAGL
jgi:endonuclease YncB( thermonuclease family)